MLDAVSAMSHTGHVATSVHVKQDNRFAKTLHDKLKKKSGIPQVVLGELVDVEWLEATIVKGAELVVVVDI